MESYEYVNKVTPYTDKISNRLSLLLSVLAGLTSPDSICPVAIKRNTGSLSGSRLRMAREVFPTRS